MTNKEQGIFKTLLRFAGKKTNPAETSEVSRMFRHVPVHPESGFAELAIDTVGPEGTQTLTASMLRNLLNDAAAGEVSGLASLFQRVLEREPLIAAHLQTRILSVLSCDWSITGADQQKAEEIENELRNAGLQDLLKSLLNAVSYGYSGAAILWKEGGRGISGFQKINPVNWVFDLGGNPALRCLDGTEKALTSYPNSQFVFHTSGMQTASSGPGGLMRPLVWLYFFKHYAMRDRARYLERFGIPFIAAKIRTEDFESETIRCEIMNSLSKLGSDGVGLLSEGSEMQVIAANSNSSGDYQTWLDYLDRLITLLILGQTASSEKASGFSKGQMQENVRRDLIEADCRALMETVELQLLRPLELFRFGTIGTLHFRLDYASPESLTEKAEIVKTLSEAGYEADPDWIARTFGIPHATQTTTQN